MWGYIAAAFGMAIGIGATLMATEPDAPPQIVDHNQSPLRRLAETATGAFGEFLARDAAIAILLFVVLYKFCDAFAGALTAASSSISASTRRPTPPWSRALALPPP
jgi:PAT family beta-lactamase induction signal transducer AmpG